MVRAVSAELAAIGAESYSAVYESHYLSQSDYSDEHHIIAPDTESVLSYIETEGLGDVPSISGIEKVVLAARHRNRSIDARMIPAEKFVQLWLKDNGMLFHNNLRTHTLNVVKEDQGGHLERVFVHPDRAFLGSHWRLDQDVDLDEIVLAHPFSAGFFMRQNLSVAEVTHTVARNRVAIPTGTSWGTVPSTHISQWRDVCQPNEALSWVNLMLRVEGQLLPPEADALELASRYSYDSAVDFINQGIPFDTIPYYIDNAIDMDITLDLRGSATQ